MLAIAKSQKCRNIYECKLCDYNTYNKYDYEKHTNTIKHKNHFLAMKIDKSAINLSQKSQDHKHSCNNCNKEYKDYSGLWRHKKKCEINIIKNNDPSDKELIVLLIKEQTKLVEQNNELLDVIKNGTYNITNSNNTNSNNKTFNLQFFLNETCKDAMNIMDFVDSIKLQLSDLENVGKYGYVEGISNIITSNLKALDINKRPVHCTDKKRDILYIKDENKWEKEDENKKKIRKAIKRVATKNALLIPKFKEVHPDCIKSVSPFSDQYNKLIIESMGGSGDNDIDKENKIIKNIVKNVTIDK